MSLAPQYMRRVEAPEVIDLAPATKQVGKGVWEARRRLNTRHRSWLVAYGRSERKALKALDALGRA